MTNYEQILNRWQSQELSTIADIDTVLSNYRILFAYHSNKIENAGVSLHQTREIFENGRVINYTGDTRALFETQNQKMCYEFLKQHILDKTAVSPDFICEVHRILNYGCYDESRWQKGERPGTYKKHFYGVGENAGVLPEDVPAEVAFLCDQLSAFSENDTDKVLKAAAYLHCNFENIHPFSDGNGRTGRTLMNYFLMIHNVPPTIIFDEDKETYYLALTVFDKTENLDGFVQFLKEQTVKTWSRENPIQSRKTHRFLCL